MIYRWASTMGERYALPIMFAALEDAESHARLCQRLGVWWGFHTAYVAGPPDADLAKYLASPPAPADVTPTVPTK